MKYRSACAASISAAALPSRTSTSKAGYEDPSATTEADGVCLSPPRAGVATERDELAAPDDGDIRGLYEHFGFEGRAVTRQVNDELLAYLGSPLDPHGRIPLAVAREIDRTSHTASLGASMSTVVSITMLGIDLAPPMDYAM